MKKKDDIVILEPGDKLFRYGLNSTFPDQWDSNEHSIEYFSEEYGHKNQIGAFFFYDNKTAALQVLSAAIDKQKRNGKLITVATISTTEVTKEITLLDLESGINTCTQMLTCLYNLGIDVVTDDFYNYHDKEKFSSIREQFMKLYSNNWRERISAATAVDSFFHSLPPFLGQSLTDFGNGQVFKKLLLDKCLDGYVFMEEFSSNTYCLFSSDYISVPEHRLVDISNGIV